jgi:hypothetical protein
MALPYIADDLEDLERPIMISNLNAQSGSVDACRWEESIKPAVILKIKRSQIGNNLRETSIFVILHGLQWVRMLYHEISVS